MQVTTFSTTFFVPDVAASSAFYIQHFGFEVAFGNDWFVSLRHASQKDVAVGGFDLCFMLRGHPKAPSPYVDQSPAGTLLGWIVDDATAVYDAMRAAGVAMVTPLTDKAYGQRHFFCHDVDGVLIDVIERIPIDPAWLAAERARGTTGV